MSSVTRTGRASGAGVGWPVLLALPLTGLALLLARPELDIEWEHHPSHFWLVLVTAAVNVALAYLTNLLAGRHRDARLVLVSLAFLAAAGFLALHALATPGVLLEEPNTGFVLATPVGLFIAAVFAAASGTPLAGPRATAVLGRRRLLLAGLVAGMVAWAIVSVAELSPLRGPMPATEAAGPLGALAAVGVVLYAFAAWRTLQLLRARGTVLLLAIVVALVLLAESMVAIALSRNWRLSWWEWHVLMLLAFGAIAAGARAEYRRSGSLREAFGGLYLEATLARIDRWHARAIAEIAAADARGEPPEHLLAELRREGASVEEVRLVADAATEVRRLDALFRPYLPTQLATRIRREPDVAGLGGVEREVSVLFADLASFTSFSERHAPSEVVAMLNAYWAVVVPAIQRADGVIEHFAGDGVMASFNSAGDQPDHARRAARTAVEILRAARPIAEANPGWPVFRVGINTGLAVVGTIGAAERRSFGVIGDTTNVAARLMSAGEPGDVVVSAATWRAIGPGAEGSRLGPTRVKGKREPVDAWLLRAIAEPARH